MNRKDCVLKNKQTTRPLAKFVGFFLVFTAVLVAFLCFSLFFAFVTHRQVFFRPRHPRPLAEDDKYHTLTSPPKIILISYDGFRWDYISRAKNTPTFRWLIKNGVYANRGLENTFITITAPNHYGIVTGLYEENHGIIANSFFDPVLNETFDYFNTGPKTDPRFFGGEPIWFTNDLRRGHRTGCVMWVGCDVPIKGHRPEHFISWRKSLDWRVRIDTLIGWFRHPTNPINLGLLYIEEPDETGHAFGPDSVEITKIVEKLDELTAYLLRKLDQAGLLDEVNLIFTADHGMAAVPYANVVNVDEYVNRSWYSLSGGSPNWNILPKPGMTDAVYKLLNGKVKHATAYKKSTVPQQYHYAKGAGVLPIQLYSDIHWRLAYNDTDSKANGDQVTMKIRGRDHSFTLKNNTVGQHGYNNSLTDMHPYFIGHGPAFKNGFNISQFMNLDLFPLMCHILGIKCPPNNGSFDRVKALLKPQWLKPRHQAYSSGGLTDFKPIPLSREEIRKIEDQLPGTHQSYGLNIDLVAMSAFVTMYICLLVVMLNTIPSVQSTFDHNLEKTLLENADLFETTSDKSLLISNKYAHV